jgi:hypothetical protein
MICCWTGDKSNENLSQKLTSLQVHAEYESKSMPSIGKSCSSMSEFTNGGRLNMHKMACIEPMFELLFSFFFVNINNPSVFVNRPTLTTSKLIQAV